MNLLLVILEQRGGRLKEVSHEVLAAARALVGDGGGQVHALWIGPPNAPVEDLQRRGADRVLIAADDALGLYQPDRYADAVQAAAKEHDYPAVLLASTALGRDFGPRIAARLGCPLAADVMSLAHEGGVVVTRSVYAGKATQTLRILRSPCVISVRPRQFRPLERDAGGSTESLELPPPDADARRAVTTAIEHSERAALDVAEATIVVSGGRGLGSPENFVLVENLAAALGGAVGASRAVVDAGWRPHAEQVGQTGKTVRPDLYVALGISGAVQHLAGMRTARVIVAINKDPSAPIFKVADYGIVGDLFEVVPKLTEAVRALRAQ